MWSRRDGSGALVPDPAGTTPGGDPTVWTRTRSASSSLPPPPAPVARTSAPSPSEPTAEIASDPTTRTQIHPDGLPDDVFLEDYDDLNVPTRKSVAVRTPARPPGAGTRAPQVVDLRHDEVPSPVPPPARIDRAAYEPTSVRDEVHLEVDGDAPTMALDGARDRRRAARAARASRRARERRANHARTAAKSGVAGLAVVTAVTLAIFALGLLSLAM